MIHAHVLDVVCLQLLWFDFVNGLLDYLLVSLLVLSFFVFNKFPLFSFLKHFRPDCQEAAHQLDVWQVWCFIFWVLAERDVLGWLEVFWDEWYEHAYFEHVDEFSVESDVQNCLEVAVYIQNFFFVLDHQKRNVQFFVVIFCGHSILSLWNGFLDLSQPVELLTVSQFLDSPVIGAWVLLVYKLLSYVTHYWERQHVVFQKCDIHWRLPNHRSWTKSVQLIVLLLDYMLFQYPSFALLSLVPDNLALLRKDFHLLARLKVSYINLVGFAFFKYHLLDFSDFIKMSLQLRWIHSFNIVFNK